MYALNNNKSHIRQERIGCTCYIARCVREIPNTVALISFLFDRKLKLLSATKRVSPPPPPPRTYNGGCVRLNPRYLPGKVIVLQHGLRQPYFLLVKRKRLRHRGRCAKLAGARTGTNSRYSTNI